MSKQDNYYKILSYLEERVKFDSDIGEEALKDFKATIRDNKYVSTYIRAFKEQMQGYDSIDDFIRGMDKMENNKKTFDDVVPYMIRDILNSPFNYSSIQNDPIKLINDMIFNALEREGKICDFRDSVNSDKKFGRCQSDEHYEVIDDEPVIPLTEDEQKEFDKLREDGNGEEYDKLIDKFNPETELELTLGQDIDTSKFDDNDTYYVCSKCIEYIRDNGDCEVSCDME